jgi:hypothetical protein
MKIKDVDRFLREETYDSKVGKQKPKKMKGEEFHKNAKKPIDKKKWKDKQYLNNF